MQKIVSATRQIGIDAGHRVTNHASKCRNLHGHRYTIHTTIEGPLQTTGSSEGMVEDFGFLKELMMQEIDAPCDHGLILWFRDPLLEVLLQDESLTKHDNSAVSLDTVRGEILMGLDTYGESVWSGFAPSGKIYITSFVPTAENLAKHWFNRMTQEMYNRNIAARVVKIRVDETPNAYAEYEEKV